MNDALHQALVKPRLSGRSCRMRQKAGRADLPQGNDPRKTDDGACSETAQ